MEFGLREILILVGLVIVAGILFDGYRRMRRARMGSLHSGHEIGGSSENDWEFYKGELPNGGARVVGLTRGGRPGVRADDEVALGDMSSDFGSALDERQPAHDAGDDDIISAPRPSRDDHREQLRQEGTDAHTQSDLFADDDVLMAARAEQDARLNKATRKEQRKENRKESRATREPDQVDDEPSLPAPDFSEVIVINVMARDSDFAGTDLQRVLASCGFHHGDMSIYHRHEQHSGKGPKLFSIANVVEPGIFDLDKMADFSTPGICMFMKLPGPKRPIHAFDIMMDCARKIANLLDADIKDEHHNPMRQQTAEHYRQRVLDFERKMLAFQAAQRQH